MALYINLIFYFSNFYKDFKAYKITGNDDMEAVKFEFVTQSKGNYVTIIDRPPKRKLLFFKLS